MGRCCKAGGQATRACAWVQELDLTGCALPHKSRQGAGQGAQRSRTGWERAGTPHASPRPTHGDASQARRQHPRHAPLHVRPSRVVVARPVGCVGARADISGAAAAGGCCCWWWWWVGALGQHGVGRKSSMRGTACGLQRARGRCHRPAPAQWALARRGSDSVATCRVSRKGRRCLSAA